MSQGRDSSGKRGDAVLKGPTQEEGVAKFRQCVRDVDAFIRRGDLEGARNRLSEAMKLEPTNPYLRAFDERIRDLEKKVGPSQASHKSAGGDLEQPGLTAEMDRLDAIPIPSEELLRKKIEKEFEQKYTDELRKAERGAVQTLEEFEEWRQKSLEQLRRELDRTYKSHIEEERARLHADSQAVIETEKQKLQLQLESLVAKQNKAIKDLRDELRKDLEMKFLERLEQISREYDDKFELLGASLPTTKEERLELYHDKMIEFYRQGQPSVEHAQKLMRLKEILELTFDEHFAVESDVRLELFVSNVRGAILGGKITTRDTKKLAVLRKKFSITDDQAKSVESYIKSSFRKRNLKGRLLVVDDDESLLQALKIALEENGFDVSTATTVNAGFKLLEKAAFDLILCDIKFPEGDLDGFKLFASVQDHPHLRRIPFVFMSALLDGVVMRSGVKLGVDDYVTKPLDIDLLLAIIQGKLKRYRALTAS